MILDRASDLADDLAVEAMVSVVALARLDLHLDYRKLNANSEKPYSYIDFVKWEHDWMKSETYQDHIGFWKRKYIFPMKAENGHA